MIDHVIYAHLDTAVAYLANRFGVLATGGGRHRGLVGWALAVDDIDAAVANARAAGVDPGGVLDGHRVDTSGSLLSWRLTSNALTAGVTPFLICWGAAAHPAVTAAPGLALKSIHIEHPDPGSFREVLAALGADVDVRGAPTPRWWPGSLGRLVRKSSDECTYMPRIGRRKLPMTAHFEVGSDLRGSTAGQAVSLNARNATSADALALRVSGDLAVVAARQF